jgi:hypothetical protein
MEGQADERSRSSGRNSWKVRSSWLNSIAGEQVRANDDFSDIRYAIVDVLFLQLSGKLSESCVETCTRFG